MKKLLLLLSVSVLLSVATLSAAQEIPLLVPAGPTGSRAIISNFLVPELNKKGWNIKIQATGNCANANGILESSTGPVLTAWDNKELAAKTGPCVRGAPSESDLVGIWYYSPDFLCRVGTQPDITKATGKVRLSIQSYYQQVGADQAVLNSIAKASSAEVRPVVYTNSGAQSTGAAANEFEYVLGSIGKKLEGSKIATCDYNTGTTEFEGTRPLGAALGQNVQSYMLVYMFGKNFSAEQMKKLRQDYLELANSSQFAQYMNERKYQTDMVRKPIADQVRFIQSTLNAAK